MGWGQIPSVRAFASERLQDRRSLALNASSDALRALLCIEPDSPEHHAQSCRVRFTGLITSALAVVGDGCMT